jgi:hypothetical protein
VTADYDDIGSLPNDGSRQKETYARYGLAMYYAQVFEHGLVNAIVLARQINGRITDVTDWDRAFEAEFRRRSSDLARRVGSYSGLDDIDRELLRCAVAERNRLAHRFFRDHSEDALSVVGMQRMLDDADNARDLFGRADAVCERLCDEAMNQLGIPIQVRLDAANRIRTRVHDRDGD